MVAEFQHGLVRLDTVLIALALIGGGAGPGGDLDRGSAWRRRRRASESVALAALHRGGRLACTFVGASWDLPRIAATRSPEADEQALRSIRAPLAIEAHLAPEDPRRFDLEHQALSKLRRVLPRLEVRYVSATSIGMFEQTAPHYGEICYDLGGSARSAA